MDTNGLWWLVEIEADVVVEDEAVKEILMSLGR
jgi:hypothetical protein